MMVAVDTNVLVYAHRRESSENEIAAAVIAGLAARPWAIPWPCIYEFFSVVTNARIWQERASRPEEAWAQVGAWLDAPTIRLLGETVAFESVLGRLVTGPRVRGPGGTLRERVRVETASDSVAPAATGPLKTWIAGSSSLTPRSV